MRELVLLRRFVQPERHIFFIIVFSHDSRTKKQFSFTLALFTPTTPLTTTEQNRVLTAGVHTVKPDFWHFEMYFMGRIDVKFGYKPTLSISIALKAFYELFLSPNIKTYAYYDWFIESPKIIKERCICSSGMRLAWFTFCSCRQTMPSNLKAHSF